MRPLLKDRVPYEGMEEANLERMQNSAMADKVSILIFAGIVIALMVIGKYFEK